MLSLQDLSNVYPNQIWINLSPELQVKAWERSQRHSNATTRCNAYLNDLCLNAFIPWLEAWVEEEQVADESSNKLPIPIRVFQHESLPSLWEFVSGTAIDVGEIRLALVPSEATELEEFCIPQEWVDIPNWRADYYLAVQVNLDNPGKSWIHFWGYVSYQKLKKKGSYESNDKAYYINQKHFSEDLSLLLLEPKPILTKNTREERVESLSAAVAQTLVENLGSSSIYCPRFTIDFEQWSALLANEKWRQELYKRRLGQVIPAILRKPSLTNLGTWFQQRFELGWQSLEEILKTDSGHLDFSFRQRRPTTTEIRTVFVEGIKLIDLGIELENQSVALLVGLVLESEQRVGVRVQLYPAGGQPYLPSNIKLALLSQSGTSLQEYSARIQDSLIQLKRFSCPRGKSFSIQVSLNDFKIIEDFAIEPITIPER